MDAYDLIVIGGGPAGVTAALRARELGASVALVERGKMGGTCTNDGCVPTRVLAKAARLVRDAEQFADYGLSPCRPTVDMAALIAKTRAVVEQVHAKKQLPEHLAAAGVTVLADAGEARFIDAHTLATPRAGELRAGKFLLCAGGHARRPDFPGSELAWTHSDIWNLAHLPRSVVVVGAAATGCQIASVLRAFGVEQVTLMETAPRLLPGEDEMVSRAVMEGFGRNGIRVLPGINGVERIERAGDGLLACYRHEKEAPECTLRAEVVVLAVGWPGNIDALNLPAAGIETERGYVKVDDTLRSTSAPHVWAAGDLSGRMLLVQSANDEARIAAENAVLDGDRRDTHQVVPHGGFTDPEYGSVGLTEAKAREREEPCAVAVVPYAALDRAVIDGRTEGFGKLIVSRASHEILGAHVVGEQALEVVQIVAAGMAAGMRVEQLADLELAYPTFAGIVGLAARQICRELGAVPVASRSVTARHLHAPEWERR